MVRARASENNMPDTLKRCSVASENRLHFIGKDAPLYPRNWLHIRTMEPIFGSFGVSFPMPRSIFSDEMLDVLSSVVRSSDSYHIENHRCLMKHIRSDRMLLLLSSNAILMTPSLMVFVGMRRTLFLIPSNSCS